MSIAFAASAVLLFPVTATARNIDEFFRDFTAEWMRGHPSLATAVRYFSGPEQDRLERQITSYTDAYERTRIKLAKQGR